uniref:Putative reverse transcriptase domain-containing protein n=1 Tax=Tanacetum cinerariifolium TaxID=118510 RepID=A0A6L2K454_TANCI|nr:putative reverse transcriptase domain-containing protein [Tanacetum cinerariifolium]
MIVSYFDKANVVSDALSRKKRLKSRRVRGMILAARIEAFKQENVLSERLHDTAESVRDANRFEYCLASSSGWTKDWESSLTGLELVEETSDKVVLVKKKPKAVTPWKGVVRFRKKGKLAPRYVGPFEILERIGLVAYMLRLPEELNNVHDTFHVSSLKTCLADTSLHVPLDEIKVDKTLCFVEEPVDIMDQEIRKLKRRNIALVKVRWNSKRGSEFIWEHEDHMRIKYP